MESRVSAPDFYQPGGGSKLARKDYEVVAQLRRREDEDPLHASSNGFCCDLLGRHEVLVADQVVRRQAEGRRIAAIEDGVQFDLEFVQPVVADA